MSRKIRSSSKSGKRAPSRSEENSRTQSPVLMTTDELLRMILSKMNEMETNMNIKASEKDSRMGEIQKIRRSLGFKMDIVTKISNENAEITKKAHAPLSRV